MFYIFKYIYHIHILHKFYIISYNTYNISYKYFIYIGVILSFCHFAFCYLCFRFAIREIVKQQNDNETRL